MKNNISFLAYLWLILIIFSGCSQKSAPDPMLIKQYDSKVKQVKKDEMRINLIRKNTIIGAGNDTYVICNHKTYKLSSGSYMSCFSNSEINTLLLGQLSLLTMHHGGVVRADHDLGNELYYYLEPMKPVRKIDADYAKTLMMDFGEPVKMREKNPFGYNTELAHLLNPAFINDFEHMTKEESNNIKNENPKMAKVIFYRPEDNGAVGLGLWTKDNFIGSISVMEYIEYKFNPGKIKVYSFVHGWTELTLDLKAGETYYVRGDFNLNWSKNGLKLIPEQSLPEGKKLTKVKVKDDLKKLDLKRIQKGINYVKKLTKEIKDDDLLYKASM